MKRPEEIRDRIANVREIESIVSTLRALAVAHQLEARNHLEAIRAHEATVAGALSAALPAVGKGPRLAAQEPRLLIVVGAGQGFCGAFVNRIVEAALKEAARGCELMVIGGRTLTAISERGHDAVWFAEMPTHALEAPALAGRVSDALFRRLAAAPDQPVATLFVDPASADQEPTRRSLFPFDFSRFPPSGASPPLTTLSAPDLVAALVEEYVFAEICEAVMMGFAAENAARATAMSRAQSNIKRITADLQSAFQRARQDQMTTEIIELSAAAPREEGAV